MRVRVWRAVGECIYDDISAVGIGHKVKDLVLVTREGDPPAYGVIEPPYGIPEMDWGKIVIEKIVISGGG